MKKFRFEIFFLLYLVLFSSVSYGQGKVPFTHVKGVVIDSLTNETLPFVAVFLKGSSMGIQTNENGAFEIKTKVNFINLEFSLMGYQTKDVYVTKGQFNDIVVKLVPTGVALKEVVIKPGKEKYSKRITLR